MTMSTPPVGPMQPSPREAGECPRCGTPYDAYQEYCIECGLRVRHGRGGVSGALADVRGGGPVVWGWPVVVTLVVALLATVAVVLIQVAADDEAKPLLVATTDQPTVPTLTELVPTETVLPTTPVVTEAPPPVVAPRPPTATGRLTEWPPGVDGYTIVLSSLPAPGGRAEAVQKAREAIDAGLSEVGVLDSAKYSSLHPGYYVVFSGVYGSMAEATRFVDDAQRAGFETAYARLIAS